jgi:hypothetical protein
MKIDCPYPGLRPFRRDESLIFFGRDEQVDELIERLGRLRLLAVVGSSGCGKSSLVRAGLIPKLGSSLSFAPEARWRIATMRPGSQPMENLVRALLQDKIFGDERAKLPEAPAHLLATLSRGPLGLVEALEEVSFPPDARTLLVVDQFEEVFRFLEEGDRDEADAFVGMLLATARQDRVPAYIVLTMRSDYLGTCDLFSGLPEALNGSQFLTPRLTLKQSRQAIEGPAGVCGGQVEKDLVEKLLNDMTTARDSLPLMQHALMRMWRAAGEPTNASGPVTLSLEQYQRIGGIAKALNHHADEVFKNLSSDSPDDRQRVAEILFRCLCQFGNAERDARRPTPLGVVAEVARTSEDNLCRVVDVFRDPACSFLTPPHPAGLNRETVLDIGHEALIRQWDRLQAWLSREAKSAERYMLLERTAALWERKEAALLGSPDYEFALKWYDEEQPTAAWARRYGGDFGRAVQFLYASAEARRFTEGHRGKEDADGVVEHLPERRRPAEEKLARHAAKLREAKQSEGQLAPEDFRSAPVEQSRPITSRSLGQSRPALILYTVYLHEDERELAYQLGLDLYAELTRPLDDPLAFGASIPVFCGVDAGNVSLQAAEAVVVIPVLGKLAFALNRAAVMERIKRWHDQLGLGHVLPLPVHAVWRNEEQKLPGKPLFTELYGPPPNRRSTLLEIVLAAARLLAEDKDRKQTALFVSHAKSDLIPTKQAAERIAAYAKMNTTAKAFFDRTELFSGESLSDQIDFAASRGMFVSVRGDSYSSRIWCQHELLKAKQHGLPTLTVEVLQKGERRSLAYGGNSPTLVWDMSEDAPGQVVLRAMIEWLRARHFLREGVRIRDAAKLPADTTFLIRPPELLDMAQGPLRSGVPQLVMYPDPELSTEERQVLRAANPRLHLVTPATAYRRVLSRDMTAPGDAPLEGRQVAMSLSDSPDVGGPEGYTKHHVVDVTVQLARTLISIGAAIAYGGDFRHPDMNDPKKQGFTILLAELIAAYNQTAARPGEYLHSYLGAPISLGEVPTNVPMTLHHLVYSKDMVALATLPPPSEQETHPVALYFSDMRRVTAQKTGARIIIGGNAVPRLEEKGGGYGGRYPGVVEEAWRSLERKQPLYVVGGFGGAAALVAELLEKKDSPIPDRLKDETWLKHDYFRQATEKIDSDPYRERLGLPRSMDDLAKTIKDLGVAFLDSDEVSVAWNGLTVQENKALFRSRDPVLVTSLVMKGLLEVNRKAARGKLAIELVHGSVTEAQELDAIAVATFDDVPLSGAGKALDEAVGGLASVGRAGGKQLISVKQSGIEADWIYLASLGPLREAERLEEKTRAAAVETADTVLRYGLRRIGVVAYGGSVVGDVRAVAQAMLAGLSDLAEFAGITWFEADEQRFEALRGFLESHARVKLTTRRPAAVRAAAEPQEQPLILQVVYAHGNLVATVLPPAGSAVAGVQRQVLSAADVSRLAAGSGVRKRATPDLATLASRGQELARLLLGDQADLILARTTGAKFVVVHDVGSSRIPFEMLRASASAAPAVGAGMSRRLAVPGVPVDHLFARPAKMGRFNVLLVINPTGDLPGAAQEGDAVEAVLKLQKERINLSVLRQGEATKAALLQAIATADVLHYCGHAFFGGPGESESGLLLAGEEPLTLADMRGVATPRVALVNACEAGRVRGAVTSEAASFAEFFLRGGVESYVGTYWEVNDRAAQIFSGEVYVRLADGATLDAAVTRARERLQQAKLPDWANYILYGDGRFRLVAMVRAASE